jgi:putative membrane protein
MRLKDKNLNVPIAIISILIPLVVAILFVLPKPDISVGFNVRILPFFHAVLNSATAILLVASLLFIKRNQIKAHQWTNLAAVGLSAIFLISYVTYHFLTESTKYGDTDHDGVVSAAETAALGSIRYIYYFILLTHILLAIVIVPLVLFTLLRAYQQDYAKHRRIAKITWPIWFYVAVTGVIVYIMIAPYYS